MSEDRFFQQVKSIMSDYQPEVPGHVYSGMRKKMWWSTFMRFDPTRLNVWYVAIAIGAAAAVIVNAQTSSSESSVSNAPLNEQTEMVVVNPEIPAAGTVGTPAHQPEVAQEAILKNTPSPASSQPVAVEATEEKSQADVAEVVTEKQAEQPKVEEPQQVNAENNEAQSPVKANKRGLKVKTYSTESEKK
jgi:hypothetical protein